MFEEITMASTSGISLELSISTVETLKMLHHDFSKCFSKA